MSKRHPGSRHHQALNQRKWQAARRASFARDGHRCRRCGVAGRLEAHHVTPLDVDPDQDPYDVDGLETLCRECHIHVHRRDVTAAEAAWEELVTNLALD